MKPNPIRKYRRGRGFEAWKWVCPRCGFSSLDKPRKSSLFSERGKYFNRRKQAKDDFYKSHLKAGCGQV